MTHGLGCLIATGLAVIPALAACPVAAQTIAQRQPDAAQRPVNRGAVVLSEHEGTLVWRAEDDPTFTLRTLVDYVAPIVWFSPDEPLLRAGAKLPQRLPPIPSTANVEVPGRVYYSVPLVVIRPDVKCAPLHRDAKLSNLDLVWNDELDAPVNHEYPPLDCLESVNIRFFFYYASEVGVSAHWNDFESVQINIGMERNRLFPGLKIPLPDASSPSAIDTADLTVCANWDNHCAFVTGVFGSAHGIAWYTNGLDVANNRDTLLPVAVLSEEGKHASAPDRNGDGLYTPGFDVDIHPNDAWGIRDILRTRWLQGPAFRADMAKRRLEKDRVFPRHPNWRIAETWAVRMIPNAAADPGKAAHNFWCNATKYDLVSMREAYATDGGELYCDPLSDQLSPKIPSDLGCSKTLGLKCEHLADLIRGEEGCRKTRVLALKGWVRTKRILGSINVGGPHDQYLTWTRFFQERVLPGVRVSGTSHSGWWIPPIAWNVPGLDGWVSARWNFLRKTRENNPMEGSVDLLYSLSAARYFSSYVAVGRDALPMSDSEAPGGHRAALEAGFKWRFSIPWINVFSGVRVGLRADDPSHLRYPRLVVEVGGGSW